MDLDYITEIRDFSEKIYLLPIATINAQIEEFRKEAQADATGCKQYQLLLMELIAYHKVFHITDIRKIEEVYKELMESPWEQDDQEFPFNLRLEFIPLLLMIYQNNDFLDRAVEIIEFTEELKKRHTKNKSVAFTLLKCKFEMTNLITYINDLSWENFIKGWDQIRKDYEWDQEEAEEIEFMRSSKILGYYSHFKNNSDERSKHLKKIIDYVVDKKRIKHSYDVMNFIIQSKIIKPEESEQWMTMLETMIDEELVDLPDKSGWLIVNQLNAIKTRQAFEKSDKPQIILYSKKVLEFFKQECVFQECIQGKNLKIYYLISHYNPESLDKEKILKIKSHFENLSKMVGTEEEYKVSYYGFNSLILFNVLCRIANIPFDGKQFVKMEKYYEGKKYSYLQLFWTRDQIPPEPILYSIEKCKKYADELGLAELHPWNLNIKLHEFNKKLLTPTAEIIESLKGPMYAFLDFLVERREEYSFIETKVQNIHSSAFLVMFLSKDFERLANAAREFLDYVIENSILPKPVINDISKVTRFLAESGQGDLASEIGSKFFEYCKQKDRSGESYVLTLKFMFDTAKSMGRFDSCNNILQELEQETLRFYGEKSPEYIEFSVLRKAEIYINFNRLDEAYEIISRMEEIAKELYGNEDNEKSFLILCHMIIWEISRRNFENVHDLIQKARKLSCLTTQYNQALDKLEIITNKLLEEHNVIKGDLEPKENADDDNTCLLNALKPNTPLKLSIYASVISIIVIGVTYYLKKK
jgi:hypothetical protein